MTAGDVEQESRLLKTASTTEAVSKHLACILASAAFKNSQRSSKLLYYIVSQTLQGKTELLKERLLGVDVFGRSPDYDTGSDHIVRSTANEIRKRLAQYYLEVGCDDDIRIELLPGSYIPQVRPTKINGSTEKRVVENGLESITVLPPQRNNRTRIGLIAAAIGLLTATLCAVFLLLRSGNAIGRLWAPVLESPGPIAICMGDPRTSWTGCGSECFRRVSGCRNSGKTAGS